MVLDILVFSSACFFFVPWHNDSFRQVRTRVWYHNEMFSLIWNEGVFAVYQSETIVYLNYAFRFGRCFSTICGSKETSSCYKECVYCLIYTTETLWYPLGLWHAATPLFTLWDFICFCMLYSASLDLWNAARSCCSPPEVSRGHRGSGASPLIQEGSSP